MILKTRLHYQTLDPEGFCPFLTRSSDISQCGTFNNLGGFQVTVVTVLSPSSVCEAIDISLQISLLICQFLWPNKAIKINDVTSEPHVSNQYE
jgi:hypothetical protein